MTQSILNPASAEVAPQAWLSSWRWDLSFIIAPAFLTSLIVLLFRPLFEHSVNLPLWSWVTLVLMVDVGHVYATLFRTYFDKHAFQQNRAVLLALPMACWAIGSMLYAVDGLLFWKALAYLAVFHFIRQQYGFVVLYSRKQPPAFEKFKWLDQACIYMATVYPMLYWHTHLPRNFNWFIEGDFFEHLPQALTDTAFGVYVSLAFLYVAKELLLMRSTGYLNIPKNLLIFGTALSWWVGIISINSDLAFTMTNVISHGIPYMALIWLFHHQDKQAIAIRTAQPEQPVPSALASTPPASGSVNTSVGTRVTRFALTYLPVFLLVLFGFAYLEEALWDGLIWREHLAFFGPFAQLPEITDKTVLALLIPLLALPQSTHYALDGFIWRVRDTSNAWSLWRPVKR